MAPRHGAGGANHNSQQAAVLRTRPPAASLARGLLGNSVFLCGSCVTRGSHLPTGVAVFTGALIDPARGHRTHVDRQEPHILGRTGTPKPMSDFSLMQVGQGGGGKLGSGEGWHARQRDPCGPKCGG